MRQAAGLTTAVVAYYNKPLPTWLDLAIPKPIGFSDAFNRFPRSILRPCNSRAKTLNFKRVVSGCQIGCQRKKLSFRHGSEKRVLRYNRV